MFSPSDFIVKGEHLIATIQRTNKQQQQQKKNQPFLRDKAWYVKDGACSLVCNLSRCSPNLKVALCFFVCLFILVSLWCFFHLLCF